MYVLKNTNILQGLNTEKYKLLQGLNIEKYKHFTMYYIENKIT